MATAACPMSTSHRHDPTGVTGAAASPTLVLVVEDYAPTRDALADALQIAGFRTEVAANGQAGYEAAVRCHPDIILMDLSLPEVDGIEATRLLKEDGRTQRTPIIALSGHRRREQEALQAGCAAFVSKPYDMEMIEEKIRALVTERRSSP